MHTRALLATASLLALFSINAKGATHTAASCSTSAVQTAINAASDGDTVLIPNGSCAWTSGISTSKQIWIRAQNYTPVSGGSASRNVTITNNSSSPLFQFTSGNNFHVRLSGIRFNEGSGSNNHVRLSGSGSKIPLIDDCYFEVKNRFGNQPDAAAFAWLSQGGVVWNAWFQAVGSGVGGQCCPEGASILIDSPRQWETASTMGMADTNGTQNAYIEDSTLVNIGQAPDIDDNGRVVIRHSKLDGAWGVTHGFTSLKGGRHFEYYNNTFSVTNSNRNMASRYFWIRAGTGIFTDNIVNNAANPGEWGSPDITDIGDNTAPRSYPMQRQPGWGHNGVNHVSDPIYIWNNTGAKASAYRISNGWGSVVQLNRDLFVNSGAKPGYSKYTYPHPLRGGSSTPAPGDTTAPSMPSNFSAQASSTSQIALSWNASSDNVGVTGYQVEHCQGSACSNFVLIASTSGTSYNSSGLSAGTTYRFRVRASDAAGNFSSYSSIASATTQSLQTDTTPPSAPGNLSAQATSTTQIGLSWNSSTDNIGVTGYQVERCQGGSCSNFTLVGTSPGTSYNSNNLTASTTYRFRIRATDAAGNLSNYSSIASATTQTLSSGPPPLPTGKSGIAAQYPGDANIQSHPDVLFADDFESYTSPSQLTQKWNEAYQQQYTRIATESGNRFLGAKALEFRVPQGTSEVSNSLVKYLTPQEDTVFVRAYTKFDAGFNYAGSSHNGISIMGNYSNPGVPANGTNKFYVDVENSRDLASVATPGPTHIYIYHPDQRDVWGDHWYSDGRVVPFDLVPGDFGPNFVPRVNFTPELNRWYSYELMVKVNTPGQRDGRIAIWIDGNLIADFLNVRLRDISSLRIDRIWLGLHMQTNSPRENFKWYDNVVIARSYIGPLSATTSLDPPTNLQTSVQ